MTQEEILEYNKRCAEFLGWKQHENLNPTYFTSEKGGWWLRELKFHSDWNWIYEVIDDIEKLKFIVNINTSPTPSEKWTQHTIKIQNHTVADIFNDKFIIKYTSDYGNNESKQKAVVNAINQFLIWYNENKTYYDTRRNIRI